MFFKPAIIAYFALLLSANAQPYSLQERDADAKVDIGKFFKGVGQDVKAYGQGLATGISKRDLEELKARDPKFDFNNIVKTVAKGVGTIDGAAGKAFLGRRDPKFDIGKILTPIEKGVGTVVGTAGKALLKVREADADADAQFDVLDLYAREAKGPNDVDILNAAAGIVGAARKQKRDAMIAPTGPNARIPHFKPGEIIARDAKGPNDVQILNAAANIVGQARTGKRDAMIAPQPWRNDKTFVRQPLIARDAKKGPNDVDVLNAAAGIVGQARKQKRDAKGPNDVDILNAAAGIVGAARKQRRDAEADPEAFFELEDELDLFARDFDYEDLLLAREAGGKGGIAHDLIKVAPGVLNAVPGIVNSAKGQPNQKRDAEAEADFDELDLFARDLEYEDIFA